MTSTFPPRRVRRITLHSARIALFVLVIWLIHLQHARIFALRNRQPPATMDLKRLRNFFPTAESLEDDARGDGKREVLDAVGKSLGYILQTSPDSDHLLGFSGPTNTLMAFAPDDRIVGVDILSSGDTRDHVAQVQEDAEFLNSFKGMTWEEAAAADVDAVSGATLTSRTIQESIIHRLGGSRTSLRFPDPLTVDDALKLFELATVVDQDPDHPSLWHVQDGRGEEIGSILRTSPHADNIIGYQGPTETRIGFMRDGRIVGISLGKSYDNEPYVTYVRDDEYFLTLFNDLVLAELARLDLEAAGVEGVSGATMTSMAVAKGLLVAADRQRQSSATGTRVRKPRFSWSLRDLGTATVILAGLAIGLSSLRRKRAVLICFQLLLIGYLGLINGDMLSQAMMIGWAQNGVPWRRAGGLVMLTMAAFLIPLTTRRNIYCTHLCPHGAAQQLLKNRLPWRIHISPRMSRVMKVIPALLLLWCVIVAMRSLPFSLVDIEPFDAWVFRVAGWPALTIAIVGLVASMFMPMAYCRYGCPTGALLNYLRLNSRSNCWTWRDWLAVSLVVLTFGFWIAL